MSKLESPIDLSSAGPWTWTHRCHAAMVPADCRPRLRLGAASGYISASISLHRTTTSILGDNLHPASLLYITTSWCGYLVWLVFDLLCLCRLLTRVQQFLHQCKSIINIQNLQIIHLLMPSPCWKPIWTLSHHIKILHLKLGCLSAKPKPMGSC